MKSGGTSTKKSVKKVNTSSKTKVAKKTSTSPSSTTSKKKVVKKTTVTASKPKVKSNVKTNTVSKKAVAKQSVKKVNKVASKPVKKVTKKTVNKPTGKPVKKVVKKQAPQGEPQKIKVTKKQKNDPNIISVEGFEDYNKDDEINMDALVTALTLIQEAEDEADDNEKENKEKRKANKKQDNTIKIKPITILKATFAIGIIVAGIFAMFTLEYFNLTQIEVKNNEKYQDSEIIATSNLKLGENVFKSLLVANYDREKLSYISKMYFGYSFPNKITISVEERYPEYIAKDKVSSKYYMIDNDGYLLEECNIDQKGDELLVEGFAFEESTYGQKINEVYLEKLDIYLEIKKLLEEAEISSKITKVNFSTSLTTIILDDKLKVIFGNDTDLKYKVSFLKAIIQKNGGQLNGTIDLSLENPVYSEYN